MTLRIMARAILPVLLALASTGLHAAAGQERQALAVDSNEQARASASIGGSRKLSLNRLPANKLDGVKGYRVYPSAEGPSLQQPEQLRKTVAHMACQAAVFGLVELEAAKTFVGKDDVGIFTKFRFRIVDDWRADAGNTGRTVDLVMQGGEIERDGQKFSVENPHASYQVGSQYVLVAGTRADSQKTIFDSPPFLEVSEELIHPAPGWTPFAPGTGVQQARGEVAAALAREGCK